MALTTKNIGVWQKPKEILVTQSNSQFFSARDDITQSAKFKTLPFELLGSSLK